MIGTRVLMAATIVTVAAIVLTPVIATCQEKEVSYQKEIRPILQAHCAVCHTPEGVGYAVSGFNVQTYTTVMRGTKYGAVVIPGSSGTSNLVWLLEHRADPAINMPKVCQQIAREDGKCALASQFARQLPSQELILIIEWVNQGAKNN